MTPSAARQLYEQHRPTSEADFQVATAKYLDTLMENGILEWFHPAPNVYRPALSRNRATAARLGAMGKKMGVKAGVPDVIIHSHRIAVELKYGRNPSSAEQLEWMDNASARGWACSIVRAPREVISILLERGFPPEAIGVKR